jgi:hypothetical protein
MYNNFKIASHIDDIGYLFKTGWALEINWMNYQLIDSSSTGQMLLNLENQI